MRGVVRDLADAAVLGTDHFLHAFLDTAVVIILAWVHNRDGISGLVVCTIESVEIRCCLRFLLNLGLGFNRRHNPCVTVCEQPIGCTS